MSQKGANHGGVRTLKILIMLWTCWEQAHRKGLIKKGIGEFKMGCFSRPLCVRSPDFARQPRLPEGKKGKR